MMVPTIAQGASPGLHAAQHWLRSPKSLLIGGQLVPARSGETFRTINPATEEVLATVALADAADVDRAVAAARRAFEAPSWSAMDPHARGRLLVRIAELIERDGEELAALDSLDVGVPLTLARGWVDLAAKTFAYYAGVPVRISGTIHPSDPARLLYMLREPMGVCGQIIPWNTPVIAAALKLAAALACGNTVVFKPAELAPLSSLRIGELIHEAGVPPGVVNIVPGHGATAGAAIASHPGIDKIGFTGSPEVGKQILKASAGNLKKVTLELGGKSPHIIFPDADLDKALEAAVRTFCGNSGQVCSAGTRLFVHESMHDEVSARIAAIASTYKVGSPLEPDTRMGPLISGRQRERVMAYIEAGRSAGAKLMIGGSPVGDKGYFVEPTVFSGVSNRMKIAREEIFGPVLSIIPFKDVADVVLQANDSEYGLSAGIWTRDLARAHQVARALQSGRVYINTYGEVDPTLSFGGYKQSGLGREFGEESIEAYTQTKAVLVRF